MDDSRDSIDGRGVAVKPGCRHATVSNTRKRLLSDRLFRSVTRIVAINSGSSNWSKGKGKGQGKRTREKGKGVGQGSGKRARARLSARERDKGMEKGNRKQGAEREDSDFQGGSLGEELGV